MNYYFAPLEGITGFIYRNTYEKYFGGIQKYFSPFITTNQNFTIQNREKKDILKENNKGIYLVPQIMTNNVEQFYDMANKMADLGYKEVNLNFGCPSRTVVTKKKGSGFLAYPEELNCFLSEIFYYCRDMEISIKTRIGLEDPEEFVRLLQTMMLTLAFFAAFRHWADKKNDHMYSDSDYDRAVNPLGPIFAVGYAMVLIVFGFAFR